MVRYYFSFAYNSIAPRTGKELDGCFPGGHLKRRSRRREFFLALPPTLTIVRTFGDFIGDLRNVSAYFDSSIGLRRYIVNGVSHVSGGTSSADRHVATSKVDLETGFTDAPARIPSRAITRVCGVDGSRYTLRSSLISPASFVRFSRPFPGGTTGLFEEMVTHECEELNERGTGLMEWLFTHPGK